jgi:hypothetical protein
MFLNRIKSKESGILLYGITPPKSETSPERISEIAERTLARLQPLDIDALVVYDVQDESARTTVERPFPFMGALDPFHFASTYLYPLEKPKIIYRPAGKFTQEELAEWLDELVKMNFFPIFVGVPAPDYKPKTSLKDAYGLWSKNEAESVIGAITIPERHAVLRDEEVRMLDKMGSGVSYFISQCIFNIEYAKMVISDLTVACAAQDIALPTIIFTLTTCGSAKVLDFMEWLGIHVPDEMKEDFLASENILARSTEVCLNIARELTDFCMANGVPFGFNIESVAIRKDEIEASIFILNEVSNMLREKGLRG